MDDAFAKALVELFMEVQGKCAEYMKDNEATELTQELGQIMHNNLPNLLNGLKEYYK